MHLNDDARAVVVNGNRKSGVAAYASSSRDIVFITVLIYTFAVPFFVQEHPRYTLSAFACTGIEMQTITIISNFLNAIDYRTAVVAYNRKRNQDRVKIGVALYALALLIKSFACFSQYILRRKKTIKRSNGAISVIS